MRNSHKVGNDCIKNSATVAVNCDEYVHRTPEQLCGMRSASTDTVNEAKADSL